MGYSFNVGITGIGIYLPEKKVNKQDFIKEGIPESQIDAWGVYEHRVTEVDEAPSDMSVKAVKNLIKNTGVDPKEFDLIIDCAFVPDFPLPGNSHKIQYEIGATNAATIDIIPSSGGIIPQLILAKSLILSQEYNKILVSCSCKYSSVVDKTDWLSCVVTGDGAAAAIVSKVSKDKGILSSHMITRGEFYSKSGIKMKEPSVSQNNEMLCGSSEKKMLFYVNGAEFITKDQTHEKAGLDEFMLNSVPVCSKIALQKINLEYKDVDFWITHQNIKTLSEYWINAIGIKERANYYYSYNKYGNLYNVNLLANLMEAYQKSYIKENDIVVLSGLHVGFSTGAIVMKW